MTPRPSNRFVAYKLKSIALQDLIDLINEMLTTSMYICVLFECLVPKESVGPSRTGVTSGCEPCDLGAGI